VVAALVGSLISVIPSVLAPSLLEQANAAFPEDAICFNGSNQYLGLTSNSNLPTGNEAYTIEAFVKSSTVNYGGIAGWGTYGQAGKSNVFAMGSSPQGYRNYHWQSDLVATTRSSAAFSGNWNHVVAQFDGTTQRIYENGFLLATNTATHSVTGTNNLTIGMANGNEWFNGCLSNLRIVKGVAVYSGTSTTATNFTVPTRFLTATQSSSTNIAAITGTQTALLLNNRNNLLQDASTWGYTLTAYNSPTINSSGPSLTPPGPSISYSATTALPSSSVSVTPVSTGSTVTAYSVSAGTPLPGSLSLNSTTGVISGTAPSTFGTYTYTINAVDGSSNSSSANFVLQVSKLTPTVTTTFATPPSSGSANTITASASAPGVISFQNNSGSISGCINISTTGSGPYTATCAWTPATGSYSITASITPSDSDSYLAAVSTAVTGTLAGPGSFTVTGSNNALVIDLPTAKAIVNNTAYTVEAFVKIDVATNPLSGYAQDAGGMYFTGTGVEDNWRQRTSTDYSNGTLGSYYMMNNGDTPNPRCDGGGTLAQCPLIPIPRGVWTHLALQKSVVSGTTTIRWFIGGKIVSSYSVSNSSTATMNSLRIGNFGSGASTSKASYSQMRITAGSLYPTTGALGSTAFIPSYDWTTSVSGPTVSSGATVIALFKPQNNSTPSGLSDLTGNGSTLRLSNSGSSVTATSDYAAPPPPVFSYSGGSRSTITGTALPSTIAASTGGDINSYSVSPALPNGINLNTSTGEISGTPTLSSPTTTYVVTGTQASSGLKATANISITVNKPATTITLQLANSAVQVGITNTITATTSTAGSVSFQTDQGVIPDCSAVATTTVSPFTATCPWTPTSSYFTLNATLTPTNSELATTTSNPALTNIRGSLSVTSTGATSYPGGGQGLGANNTLRLLFPEGTGLVTSQSYTIETWVKVNNPILNVDINAFYGNSFYGDRGNGISVTGSDTRVYNFLNASVVNLTVPASPFVANNQWVNVVYQRKVVPGNPSEGYDAVFINGQLVQQTGTGGWSQGDPATQAKSTGVRIGPFNGAAQIGPTQVLSGVAAYPLTGFSPATTFSFGANTLALFQPSSTSCNSSAVAPQTVTASTGASTAACSTQYPVASPTVTSVVANSGPLAGQNTVVINGTNFVDLVTNGLKFGTNSINVADYAINTFGTQITVTKVPAGTGTIDVTVQTAGGTSTTSASSKYSYVAAPTITSLSPSVGAEAGGIGVVIEGTGFTNVSAVTFGSSNATSYTVNSATRITANFPAGLGSTYVKVTTPGGSSAENSASTFTYTSATSVTSISPSTGATGGGTVVEISGTNFTSSSTVVFGTTAATNVSYNSTTGKLTATSPAGTNTANVRVTTAGSQSATAPANLFTYTATVAVSAISATFGPTTGGTVVEISGTNFTSSSTVVFGTTAATNVSYNSETGRLTATSPAGTGTVNVRVTTGASPQSATATANQFIYYAPPTITALSRSTGPNAGGSSVIITGTNFTPASTVVFGTNNVTTFTVNSTTQITATSPAGSGAVDVRVTNEGGTSADVVADNFTYFPLPAVTIISPATGTTAGGTSVTITGQNFIGTTGVKFGTSDAVFTVDSATQITATAPAGTGEVNITVITPGGTSTVALYGKFTYVSPPTLSSISPSSGMINGGQDVIITGIGLNNLLVTGGVLFGTIPAQTVSIIDSTQIRVVTPVTTVLGEIDIFLVNSSGSSVASSASKFTYTKANDAKLSALTLSQGTLSGVFSPTTNTYTALVINSVDKVTLTPTVNQVNATVQVKVGSGAFETVVSGSASLDLPLAVGANTILVKVTAHDETTVNTYTITLTRLSNDATLLAAAIKAQTATLGTPNASLASVIAGEITLTTAQATGGLATVFTKTDAGAAITKIVKYATGASTSGFETDTAFANSATTAVANGDFFIVKVTAADGTVNYSRFNVTVNSDVATLSSGLIKGQTATLGTPSAILASAVAGAITLTTAQATGTDTTTFTKTDAGATITKIVKYATGASMTNFETDAAFTNGAATAVSHSDFFIVKVTAADASVRFYRINVTVNSNVATLSASTVIKGLAPTSYGTSSATLGSETPGAITLTTALATGSAVTTFVKTDAGATITKIVKYGTGAPTSNFEIDTAFTNSATATVANGDFFIIKVTAQDGTVNFSRFSVTVNSNVATLSAGSIKGQSSTVGTAGSTLGSLAAGAITLTTAQATGTDTTTFTKTDAGATITKIVKLASSATENSTNFNAATAFTNGSADTVSNGDYFIIQVTAADATVSFTRFNVTVNSNIATLSSASIKGLTSTLGTPNAVLTSVTAGTITLTTAQATGTDATTFTKTDVGATITRIVKYSSGAPTANFETDTAFTNSATSTVANGDFFIVKVTAADATVNFYRFNVTVNSDVATLSAANIKGLSATVGTAGSALGALSAGTITLTTAQAAGVGTSTFTKTDAGATITKIAKLASTATENSTNFNAATAFTNGSTGTVSNGDYFIVQVTAADSTVNYSRFNVAVNSNVATLSAASIKGFSATLGTPGTALGSLTAGTVTLSVSQATGTTATTFTKTDAGATITKIAKLASGTVENLTSFNAAAAFTNGTADTVSNGDFFIIQITAADSTVNYTRVNLVFATNPTVPLSLSATAQAGGANLTWNAPTGDGGSSLTGYEIEASTDAVTWASVGTTNLSTTQFSVTTLNNGTAYRYRVRATNSSGDLNYNWATSAAVTSFYYVICSTSGSFHVSSTVSPVQIPSRAGENCRGEVTIPQGIVQINSNVFTFNTETTNRNITKVTFPTTGLRTIDQGAFKNLGLTSVSIPATVETVGIYSFMNNYITTVYVAGTGSGYHPTALLDSAFKGNPAFTLTLGSGKIEIGETFGTATSFASVDWGTGLKSIGRRAFYNVSASGWAPLFPATITTFDAQAFEGTGIKTIRFGTATTHEVTSIATSAFDQSITSVQYCGISGTILSNYINSRFTSKTIWCSEDVPNAPINLTATAGSSGQVQLSWSKGATRAGIEAPTDGFDIRYSADGGSTWSALLQAAGTATSLIVPNLSNGTSYIFQIRAKNLFGASTYSANASATPLGTQVNPTFGPSTSTAAGFTVNVINYDATYTYSVPQFTAGSGTITVGTPTGNILPITVTGMTPGSVATISIDNQKTGFAGGTGVASGSALNAAKVPVIGNIVTLTGGFTAAVTNYDSAFTWNVSSSLGTATINTQGGISVSGVAPSTSVQLTVNATRATYAAGSTQTTVTTLALLQVIYNGTRATGGAVPTDSNSYASNSSATVLANPASGGLTLNGYYLSGWSLNADESGQSYQPNASIQLGLVNITLYAKWTLTQYTVTYYANGATGGAVPVDSNTYTMGGSVPISANTGNLTRTGYSFIGWGISSTDTGNPYVSGNTYTVGTNNIALWARWSANTYRVTYDANGGTGAPSKAYDDYTTAGTAVNLATRGTLAKSGYDFNGWGISAVSTPVADPFTTADNIDLYAQWNVASFAVTYQLGTYGLGTLPTQTNVNYGNNFTVAAATGLTGSDGTNPYAFVSWSDGTKTYAPGQSILMGAGAVTLTAQWTRIYNVTYSFNGGSVTTPIADQQKIAGDTIVISSAVPTRAGYDFVSWKDQSGETALAGANYEVRANHYLLYAQWTAKSFSITYDVNGGNTTPTQANRSIGQIFTVAAAPTKVGHDFEYWSDGTNNYNPGADYQVGISNVILQAVWSPKVFRISYNFNGGTGTPISTQNYTYGTGPAVLPASGPTRFEFNFLGWATTPTATTPVSASFAPSGDILVHAVWVTSVYRLTFNAGLGISDSATATVTIGQSMSLPGGTRSNYTLQGWSTTETGGTTFSLGTPYTPTTDGTLFARWVPQVFTVSYNGNGGTAGRASDSVSYNAQTQLVLPTATRANYVFKGWYSQATGGYLLGEAGANYLPTASITAYAHWIQGSLSGMGPATMIAQLTVRDGINTGFNAGSNGSTATVTYTAGALPDGTVITAYLEESVTRVTSLLQTPATPILSLIIAWVAPDGTVPDTNPAKPIVMTVANSSITAGSKVYGLVGNQPELLGIAQVDGQVQVSITKDPAVVVAMVAPDAPTGVTATAIDTTSATISWTAPTNSGGSAITGYTARSNSTQTCTATTATSCVMTGLVTGTAYTFTVVATNAIGDGAASTPSASLTLSAPTPPSVPSAPAPSAPSGSGSSGSGSISSGSGSTGSGSSTTTTVNPTPVVASLPVITSLKFVENTAKNGGRLVWVGSNIESVLFTGDSSTYPDPYNYGAFTITWSGELINIVRGKTYTAKLDFRSASGGNASRTIEFTIGYTEAEIAAAQAAIDAKAAAEKKALDDAIAATKAAAEKAAADAKAAAELKAAQERAAAEAAAAAALKAAQEISDAKAKAAAELKAAQDKAAEDARIAAELKAAQEKAEADLKAAAEKKALEDAAAAAALAAKKIVPKISLYSISSKLTLSAYDNAYLNKYISTLKSKAIVTCIGYYYTKNTTLAKAKALATTQATAVCKMIKKAKPTVVTKIVLYSSTKAPKAAQGAKWVAVSYRVDSFKTK
jgi:uncharacterized repeat protein (TIGR02543 family)